jgi:hypothetical protein
MAMVRNEVKVERTGVATGRGRERPDGWSSCCG